MVAIDSEVVRLVQVTQRTFYENKYAVVMDQLVRKEASVCLPLSLAPRAILSKELNRPL